LKRKGKPLKFGFKKEFNNFLFGKILQLGESFFLENDFLGDFKENLIIF
jgi:hypothetical protein